MENVKTVAIERALKMLSAANCKYAVIDEDGKKYGELEIKDAIKAKRKRGPHPFGAVRGYIKEYADNLDVGEVAIVPCDRFGPEYTMRNCSSFTVSKWGKKSAVVSFGADKKNIEILRVL